MARLLQHQSWHLISISPLIASSFFINLETEACAQSITLDGTLGTPGTLTGPDYTIPQAAGQAVGNNLFHSFGKFNLNTNEAAIFQSNPNIQNILSRVTGGTQSVIDGLIRTQTGVNLFLINPNGIIFGKNASLDVGGSFVASTANALQFGNLGFFSATEKNVPSPLLTINPSALFFNQINQNAAIQNNSVKPAGKNPAGVDVFGLRVPDGKSLLLVGGNVNLDGGRLNAFGGRVELGGLAAPGNVNLVFNGDNLSLKFPEHVVRADISLTNQAAISVQAAGGGNIAINARNIDILGGSQLSAGIGRDLGTPETVAGDITLNATGEIKVAGQGIFNRVNSGAKGNGGNIYITTEKLLVQNTSGFEIASYTLGTGNAGNIYIKAKQLLVQNTPGSAIASYTNGTGNAGNISITSEKLLVQNTPGSAIASYTQSTGNAGNISIETVSLSVINSQISSLTLGKGNAGNLTIHADSVEVTGKVKLVDNTENPGGLFAQVNPKGEGRGGELTIITRRLSVSNGSKVQVANFGQGVAGNILIHAADVEVFDTPIDNLFATGIYAGVEIDPDETTKVPPKGNGGTLTIETERLSVRNGAKISSATSGEGNAGKLLIHASDFVEVVGTSPQGIFKSEITAAVTPNASGITGDIEVNSPKITLDNKGQVTASSASGNGGNININSDLLLLRRGAQISTNAGTEEKGGDGGNININSKFIVAVPNENSDISANAFTGTGGKVTINATGIYGITPRSREDLVKLLGTNPKDLDPANLLTSDITAISQTSPILNGDVILNIADLDPSRGLFQLPTNLVDVSQQIAQRCTPKGKTRSHFISTGRGGLPLNPDEPLRGRAVITNWVTLGEGNQQTREIKEEITQQPTPETIVEAQGWVINADGNVELVAYVPRGGDSGAIQSNSSCAMVTSP